LRFASNVDADALHARLRQLCAAGCRGFALLFDDLPLRLSSADERKFQTPARAQAEVANQMRRTVARGGEWLFCPTV